MHRLQLIWDSPNLAGMIFAASCLALLPYSCLNYKDQKNKNAILILIFISFALLLMTESRGAIFGFVFAVLVFLFSWRSPGEAEKYDKVIRITELAVIGIFFYIIWPNASSRFNFLGSPGNDAGVNARCVLWRSACVMVHDNPFGIGEFGKYFAEWYQPTYLRGYFDTPISDPLNIAVKLGYIPLSVAVLAFNFFIALFVQGSRYDRSRNLWMIPCLLVLVSSGIASLFSTLMMTTSGAIFLILVTIVISINLIYNSFSVINHIKSSIIYAILVSAVIIFGFYCVCNIFGSKNKIKLTVMNNAECAESRVHAGLAKVLVIDTTKSENKEICRFQMRCWVDSGWTAGLIRGNVNDIIVANKVRQWVLDFGTPDLIELNGVSSIVLKKIIRSNARTLESASIICVNMNEDCRIGKDMLTIRTSEIRDAVRSYPEIALVDNHSCLRVPWSFTWPRQISRIMPNILKWANAAQKISHGQHRL